MAQIQQVTTRFRARFAYIDATVAGEQIKLCRLRYAGYANQWGFAIYRAGHNDYHSRGGCPRHSRLACDKK